MLEGCLVQPFFELGVRKLELGEFFGFPYKNKENKDEQIENIRKEKF
jgi:hypothetical protein